MRLLVKHCGRVAGELEFKQGPICIGRQMGSELFLPDVSVSRRHAVITNPAAGSWVLEDLNSANKTLLNDIAIHKNEIKDGDVIRIGDFIIEVNLEEDQPADERIHLKDTHITEIHEIDTLVRKFKGIEAGLIRLPPARAAWPPA